MPRPPKHAIVNASLALKIPGQPLGGMKSSTQDTIYEGWMLKKRRKRMQGYARRYFTLWPSGLLSYSFEPGMTIRDQIYLGQAAISSTQDRCDIHIDSERVTFHMKCLTREDFDHWMTALRKFTTGDSERLLSRRSSIARAANSMHIFNKANELLEEMGSTIESITETYMAFEQEDTKKRKDRSLKGKEKDHREGGSVFSLFKKAHPHLSHDDTSIAKDVSLSPNEHMHALLETLRLQHKAVKNSLLNLPSLHANPSNRGSPLPSIADEGGVTPTRSTPPMTWQSGYTPKRTSLSSYTDNGSVWYDASEGEDMGAEEFVLEPEEIGEDEVTPGSKMVADSQSSITNEESDIELDRESSVGQGPEELETRVTRRTQLPVKPSGEEGSLFAVLKKSVGQDLSNISFPVTFNEPLTLLQRSAEELEYHDLLDRAAATTDWMERMCYVAAFAVSGYACTKHRPGRKGFTPMLGETFEDVRTKFIAEKVVHKPLLMAYHAEGSGWELSGTSAGKTKFWGKSLEIIPTGINHVMIGKDNFHWSKPSSFTRNLMMGTKYLEHCGEMVVKNESSGARCVLDFKETGYWASSPNVVSGHINSPDGRTVGYLEGKWDEQFSQKVDSDHLRVLWRISPFPRNASEYYGYTFFGITLNEITSDIKGKLPPTDSRFRPDVRALEEGNIPLAESEKARLETMQRERREQENEPSPRWFKQVGESDRWVYVGGYWEERGHGWKNTEFTHLW